MRGVRAFVGHSFSPADKELISVFLDHFKTLSKTNPEFQWDHAEEAEPAPLAAKVLAKIENKNVFIGICTKKEAAVEPRKLLPGLLTKNVVKIRIADIEWKTQIGSSKK